MLILSRRSGECFYIRTKNHGEHSASEVNTNEIPAIDIKICVISTGVNFCRIGVAASDDLLVLREELADE